MTQINVKKSLTLYGRDETGSAAVEALLVEAAIPFTLINVPSNSVTDPELIKQRDAYHKINPMAQVPTLKINDYAMTESAAIMLWLGDVYGEEMAKAGFFIPGNADILRADYLRWLFFFATEHYQAHLFFAYAKRWTDNDPKHTELQRAKAHAAIERQLTLVEQRLGGDPYFYGDKISPLDFYAAMLFGWNAEISKFPRAAAHMKRVALRAKSADIWARHKVG